MQKMEPRDLAGAVGDLRTKTPDQLADLLKKYGLTGRPCTTQHCPIAKLMHVMYGSIFIVGPKFIAIKRGKNLEKIPTPSNIAQFVRAFDLSRYPDLIAPPPRAFGKRVRKVPKTKRGPSYNHPAREVGR